MTGKKIKIMINDKRNAAHYKLEVGSIVEENVDVYIEGVVAAEIGNAPLEACKALAITARTFAMPFIISGKPITDEGRVHQVFLARLCGTMPNAATAALETSGTILTYKGKYLANAQYSSTNNGETNRMSDWDKSYKDRDYLVNTHDEWSLAEIRRRSASGQIIRYGHGVGLSQYGAIWAGRNGIGYRDILSFYFPNTLLITDYESVFVTEKEEKKEDTKEKDGGEVMPTLTKTESTIISFARSKVGLPYKWGSAGPSAYDCSGLTKAAMQQVGIRVYHGATSQYHERFSRTKNYWQEKGLISENPAVKKSNRVLFLFNCNKQDSLVMEHVGLYDPITKNTIQAGGYGGSGVHEEGVDWRRWTHYAILNDADANDKVQTTASQADAKRPTLRRSSRGADVRTLQGELIIRGYDIGRTGIDGIYGAKTVEAVKSFQRSEGLVADGICGAKTWAAIFKGR